MLFKKNFSDKYGFTLKNVKVDDDEIVVEYHAEDSLKNIKYAGPSNELEIRIPVEFEEGYTNAEKNKLAKDIKGVIENKNIVNAIVILMNNFGAENNILNSSPSFIFEDENLLQTIKDLYKDDEDYIKLVEDIKAVKLSRIEFYNNSLNKQ